VKLDKGVKEAAPAVRAQKSWRRSLRPVIKNCKSSKAGARSPVIAGEGSGDHERFDRRDKEQELARLTRELQRMQREFREDLNLRRNEEDVRRVATRQTVIQQIAEAEKFDLILQDAVYISPRIDITDKVIKALATSSTFRYATANRREKCLSPRIGSAQDDDARMTGTPASPSAWRSWPNALAAESSRCRTRIHQVAPAGTAGPEELSFLANRKYQKQLASTRAVP